MLQSTFHLRLQQLADEHELVCAENAAFRKALSLEQRPATSMGMRTKDVQMPQDGLGADNAVMDQGKVAPSAEPVELPEVKKAKEHLPGMIYTDLESEGMEDEPAAKGDLASKGTFFHSPPPEVVVRSPTVSVPKPPAEPEPDVNTEFSVASFRSENANLEEVDEDSQQGQRIMLLLDIIPAIAIVINGICTGVQTDFPEPEEMWKAFEYFFLVFFTLEILIKVKLFSFKEFVWGRDWYWGWFDMFCVGAGLLDIIMAALDGSSDAEKEETSGGGVSGLLKLLKLARLGRIIRLLRFKIFAELKSMITGVFTGLKVLFWAIILLFLLMYMFGLTTKILFSDTARYPEFSTLPSAMFTVFRCFTDGCAAFDGTPLQERMRLDPALIGAKTDVVFFFAYFLIYLFITVGIFNLIMAVFIDNVNDGSVKKKQHYIGASADKMRWVLAEKFKQILIDTKLTPTSSFTKYSAPILKALSQEPAAKPQTAAEFILRTHEIRKAMHALGLYVSKEVFDNWLQDQEAALMEVFDEADIDVSMKFELFELLDADLGGTLDFEEIITGLMKCRGPVSKVDVVSMGMKVKFITELVQEIHEKVGCEAHGRGRVGQNTDYRPRFSSMRLPDE